MCMMCMVGRVAVGRFVSFMFKDMEFRGIYIADLGRSLFRAVLEKFGKDNLGVVYI
jgi:hypothetical protein